jgi:hypothetical protein
MALQSVRKWTRGGRYRRWDKLASIASRRWRPRAA